MPSSSSILSFLGLLAMVSGHSVILNVQGIAGTPASVGFQVDPEIARNCTSISPCQQDATLIRDAEIKANVVNECGRTEINGNIDIGENTENALSANAVTQVEAGTQMTVTIHQVNADGAGPYACDLVEAGNNGVITQNLTVANNVPGVNGFSQAKEQDFNVTVTMPDTLACTGSSAGNVCTVRCRNNALAGPFGGCFPVQQVDTTASKNVASAVDTNLSLEKVQAQVAQDKQDLPAAIKAVQDAGTPENLSAAAVASSVLGLQVTSSAAPVQTVDVVTGIAAAAATATADASNNGKKGKGNDKNNQRREVSNFRTLADVLLKEYWLTRSILVAFYA
ncbi:Uu.00g025650.m01.CDS01 [Anthostomella pinea]|uniref:Uu.00g025650.m01.CDS01 n=1 Tax=Anthostomella pinea TaxID=933095 RepID=A0AAI8YCI7_9PEZI|nr:Uu.00g025650.m01.CDS01 [Anthostomella pinea]